MFTADKALAAYRNTVDKILETLDQSANMCASTGYEEIDALNRAYAQTWKYIKDMRDATENYIDKIEGIYLEDAYLIDQNDQKKVA